MESYSQIQELYARLPPFAPIIPTSLLPYIALFLCSAAFLLGFYFTTLPRTLFSIREVFVALVASVLAGFGVVALFNYFGVYV
ncbi:hypothetical protein CALVIDRAFT_534069 [Calocera viscosa TUFC12733]|uniref:Dolichyl-diphosphooligosaccharide-protein glycosyltransferase subunit OST5 n=1 Tax=Calocera viscosa (strain TUFC12733) TaxID=1330018 RepID=A0A167QD79_CALVF|nr:hypothetical protein CALVIDRAFT_534069 [Calocera viscosa TUFC12733]